MYVKRRREDFVVREVSDFPLSGGKFAVYRLNKSGIGTPEAVREICNIWNLPSRDVSYGGLKDRHAVTSQLLTVFRGPRGDLEQSGFTVQYLGQSPEPFAAGHILANDFEVTLRELAADEAPRLREQLQSPTLAIPNYFDEQRFGSVGVSGRFVAHPWCLGDYEQALFLAIAEANSHDRPEDREQKETLRAHWGDWQACKDRLDRSHRRSIVTYLVDHPQGFKKAVALIRKDLRGIFVAAFQAKLWNEVVSRRLVSMLPPGGYSTLQSVAGEWALPMQIPDRDALAARRVPLPSGRRTDWPSDIRPLLEEVLSELGMQLHQLRFSYPRDVFFARGLRDMLLIPQHVVCELSDDEMSKTPDGRKKLQLNFQLQPGQYATMLVKGISRPLA